MSLIAFMSPAKALREEILENENHLCNNLIFNREKTNELVNLAKQLSVSDLMRIMQISEPLAKLNYDRFIEYADDYEKYLDNYDGKKVKKAGFMFNGDAYEGLDIGSLNSNQLEYLDKHLYILSGLYGILRISSLIRAYRLEMGRVIDNLPCKSLPDFWSNSICEYISNKAKEFDKVEFVNLASEEYSKAIEPGLNKMGFKVYKTRFESIKNDKRKVISFEAKKARGLFARHMALTNASDFNKAASEFNLAGWRFDCFKEDKNQTEAIFVKA